MCVFWAVHVNRPTMHLPLLSVCVRVCDTPIDHVEPVQDTNIHFHRRLYGENVYSETVYDAEVILVSYCCGFSGVKMVRDRNMIVFTIRCWDNSSVCGH